VLTGTGGQTFKLPDATTLTNTTAFEFNNNATGTLTIVDSASGSIGTIAAGGAAAIALLSNATVAGTWDVHAYIPENVQWGTNSLALGSTVITGGTWNGGTITSGYGGTGLTTFTGANNALYSTSASALAAGTLPVAAGGTGATTLTTNGVVYGNGTSAAGITAAGTTGQVLIATTSGAPSWGSVPASGISGTVAIANGGTGQTTAAAAFNALNPMTTTGDMLYEASASTAARLAIGTSGQVLTVAGGIPSWAAAPGSSTLNITEFTATSGQTSFSVTYTVGLVEGVYRNGIKLGTADYTATTGTTIVLGTGAITGDLVQVVYFTAVAVTNVVNTISFGSTGLTPSTATSGAVSVAGTLAVGNGGTGLTSTGTSGNVLTSNGSVWVSSAPAASGATITGTTTSATYYVVGTTLTSGTLSTASISNTNAVSYNASTGALTAVSMVSSSDECLKTNWVGLDTDFVSRLADVKHGTFERISSGNREVGVTAQSLKDVLPEAVIESEEGLLGVNYGGAALVAAIELAKEIKELRAEIKALKAELNK